AARNQTLMLTQDGDIIDARFAVQYQVSNPRDYLFNVRDPDGTVKEVAESAVRQVIGQNTLDSVIHPDPTGITSRVKTLIQAMLDRYRTGIQIVNVSLQNAQPPAQVKKAFDDAVKAREEARRVKSDAQTYADTVVPEARAAASRMIEQANAYKTGVIDKAQGKTSRFLQLLAVYRQAPEITRKRLYLDAMESVLSRSSKVLLDVKKGNNVFYLPLGEMIPRGKPAAGEAKPAAPSPPPPSLQEQKPRNRAPVRQREAH
ncbi:MAG: FtsH protease activity modulator HflK, partial [Gammaproteobacteria bacterium]|nr:FtsH protease activity modulator HflK [Gammaproteobacteria bacterium]